MGSANTAAVPEIGKSVGVVEEAGPAAEREVGEDDDDDDGDDDATNDKQRANRIEAVSYAANDEDDDKVQAQMQKEAEPEDDEDMEDEGIGGSPRDPASDDEEHANKSSSGRQNGSAASDEREARVMKACNDIVSFRFDESNGEWCNLTLEYDADVPKVLMLSIVEDALRQSLSQQIPGLATCTFVPDEKFTDPVTGKDQTSRRT